MIDSLIIQVKDLVEAQGVAWEKFKTENTRRFDQIEKDLLEIQKKANRLPLLGDGSSIPKPQIWIDVKTKHRVPVLEHKDSLAALHAPNERLANPSGSTEFKQLPSMGRVLRGIVLGGRADDAGELAEERKALGIAPDPAGGYTVQGTLSSQWIDALRAQMVLSQAGAVTVPMDSATLTLAKVTGDPEAFWHKENAQLGEGQPTFGAVTLNANTVVCLVRMSIELAQDSANIEQILQSTLTNALALKIDQAGLVGTTVDSAVAPSGIMNLTGRNTVTGIGAPENWDFLVDGIYELLADNVPMERIGAMIAHPGLWKNLRKLKTGLSGDNTPLAMPAEIQTLPKLWTTSAPLTANTAKAIIGDWRDLIFGIRQQMQIKVLTEAFMGSNLQVGVLCFARCDYQAARQQSFCTLEGITV